MPEDVRRYRRFRASMPMVLEHAGDRTVVESEDVSMCGVCVRSVVPVEVYAIVNLILPMPTEAPIHLTGMVVHNGGPEQRGARPVRIDLHFFDAYPRDRWQWLVSTIAWRADLEAPLDSSRRSRSSRAN